MTPLIGLISMLLGCADGPIYNTTTQVVTSDTGAAAGVANAYASPQTFEVLGACDAPPVEIALGNVGDGSLTLRAVNVEGDYRVPMLDLPLQIEPGGELAVSLDGVGEGAIEFVTDDPQEPLRRVPLLITLDAQPEVQLLNPPLGTVVQSEESILLEALVVDSDSGPMDLVVEWFSSAEGSLGTSLVGLDGRTQLLWEPSVQGEQTVTVSVVDTCGNRVNVEQSICRQGEVRESPLRSLDWELSGTTYVEPSIGELHLTDDEGWSIGSAFWMERPVDAANLTLDLEFYVSSATLPTADGMALVLLDAERFTTFLGPGGGGMGFGEGVEPGPGLPGAAIEIDTSYNSLDPTRDNHVALSFDGRMESPAYAAPVGDVDDGRWHALTIEHEAPYARAYVDGVLVADVEVRAGLDFAAYIGFTAATGTYTSNHWVRDVVLTTPACVD